jgi:MFS family permease
MITSLLLAATGGFLLLYSNSYTYVLASLCIIGAGFAASFPVILGYIGQVYANLSGTAFSIAFVIALTGSTLINYLFGVVSNVYGTKQLPVFIIAIIVLLLTLILWIKQKLSSKIKM